MPLRISLDEEGQIDVKVNQSSQMTKSDLSSGARPNHYTLFVRVAVGPPRKSRANRVGTSLAYGQARPSGLVGIGCAYGGMAWYVHSVVVARGAYANSVPLHFGTACA